MCISKSEMCFRVLHVTSGTRDLRTPMATPLQPPRTLCLVIVYQKAQRGLQTSWIAQRGLQAHVVSRDLEAQ